MSNELTTFFDRLCKNSDTEAIILFGSRATDTNRPDSDADVIVVSKSANVPQREVDYVGQQAFELIILNRNDLLQFWQWNPDDCISLWRAHKIIVDHINIASELEKIAKNLEAKGKTPVETRAIVRWAFEANDEIAMARRLESDDPANAAMILYNRVYQSLQRYFDVRQEWRIPPKKALAYFKQHEPQLYSMVISLYSSHADLNTKIQLAINISHYIFDSTNNHKTV